MTILLAYAAYAAITVPLTIWLARVLYRNGEVLLLDVFEGNPRLASAVNRLLVVGFYLMNLGYACLRLPHSYSFQVSGADAAGQAVEALAASLGWVLVTLAFMHFFNLFVLHRIRRNRMESAAPPPL